jgi:hypothetical protein
MASFQPGDEVLVGRSHSTARFFNPVRATWKPGVVVRVVLHESGYIRWIEVRMKNGKIGQEQPHQLKHIKGK